LPRLVIGLFLVVALVVGGRVWDSVFDKASVSPDGLMAEPWTDQDAADSQEVLRAELDRYGVTIDEPADGVLHARDVLKQIQRAYPDRLRDLREKAMEADGEDAAAAVEETAVDEFQATYELLDGVRPRGTFEATASHVTKGFNRLTTGLVYLNFGDFFGGLGDLLVWTPVGAWRNDPLFVGVFGFFFIVVMAVGGGALSRMAAVEIATGEKLRLREAIDFALSNWQRLLGSLVLPLLIAAVLSVLLLVGGFFLMLPWLDVIGGLLYGVALLMGFGVVFLLAGYAGGFSLLVPAVASENCDAADAQQRAYAYVISHPLHLLGYGFVALIGLAVGYYMANLLAVGAMNVTGALVDAATSNQAVEVTFGFGLFDPADRWKAALPLQLHSEWSAALVMFWQTVVVCLLAGYVFSYYFSASTFVYMLMRRVCDGQDLDEIWQEGELPGSTVAEYEDEAVEEEEG
ncbi:MAG: hypothetical protein V3S08_00195, partial [Phycisphaerales bacterium]